MRGLVWRGDLVKSHCEKLGVKTGYFCLLLEYYLAAGWSWDICWLWVDSRHIVSLAK